MAGIFCGQAVLLALEMIPIGFLLGALCFINIIVAFWLLTLAIPFLILFNLFLTFFLSPALEAMNSYQSPRSEIPMFGGPVFNTLGSIFGVFCGLRIGPALQGILLAHGAPHNFVESPLLAAEGFVLIFSIAFAVVVLGFEISRYYTNERLLETVLPSLHEGEFPKNDALFWLFRLNKGSEAVEKLNNKLLARNSHFQVRDALPSHLELYNRYDKKNDYLRTYKL
ncbi:MAG: hypothetical protein C5B53_00470 [Candidatus Melainabacteria bacterium]|nr:MAG: hypothetical protein C5B53_00470 [Candidatus Melainabacteria bacterium]